MQRVFIIFLLLLTARTQAQFISDNETSSPILRFGAGYTHDFPGLNGYTALLEYSLPMTRWMQAAIGGRYMNLQGNPRTETVGEFTRGSAVDFTLYLVPLKSYHTQLRLGIGYSFVFYDVRRSYPVYAESGADKTAIWQQQDEKGRCSGLSFAGEFAFAIPKTRISFGIRAAWLKSYDRVTYAGPFFGIRF